MKLTNEQIRPILFGAAEIVESDGILHPYKCTAPIRAAWYAFSHDKSLGRRAEAPTGIRLDFHTDAREITFTVAGNPFEVQIDGLYAQSSPKSETPLPLTVETDGKGHRITLLFPFHDNITGTFYAMEISDGATVTPHKYDTKFLFLGDSITQGWNAGKDGLCYAWRTAQFFNADCIIHGVGGGFFDPSIFEAPAGFDPDRIFVAFGTNDFVRYQTLDELRLRTGQYLDLVVGAFEGKKIYGITPIWRLHAKIDRAMGSFDQCIAVIREEYEKRSIPVIDGLTLVPHDEAFFADAVHPNALGFAAYSQNLIREILNSDKE